jgi:hypothetical protein
MNEQELNKKLAEWAGFKEIKCYEKGNERYAYWIEPVSEENYGLLPPNFTQSFDACFKWLVPKLYGFWLHRSINCRDFYFEGSYGDADGATHYNAEANTPALALCLAIEKLIDSEEKK